MHPLPHGADFAGGLSDYEGGYRIPENLAGGVGTAILLLIIAGAVALFLSYGRRMEPYEAWEHEPVELAYGVTGMVEKEKALYEGQHTRLLILGWGCASWPPCLCSWPPPWWRMGCS